MSMELLCESLTLDTAKDFKKREDLYESLEGKKIIIEGKEINCLGIYETTISRPNVRNKNNRLYTTETWAPVLERHDGEGSLGLINHPKPGDGGNLHDAYCVWRNHRMSEDMGKPVIKADMFLLNNDNGKHILSIIECGGMVDLSTRGFGELKENNTVHSYQYKATDAVLEGSYGVRFGKSEEKKVDASGNNTMSESTAKESPKVIEEQKKEVSIKDNSTNNKQTLEKLGENKMVNKLVIDNLLESALNSENAFTAYKKVQEISESIKTDAEMKDLHEKAQSILKDLGTILEADQEGDSEDNGSADDEKMQKFNAQDPEKKIQDTKEKLPDMVKPAELANAGLKDTTAEGRGGKAGFKAMSAQKAMAYEVKSGEIMSVKQGIKEDTDESEPDMIDTVEVDKEEDDNVGDAASKTDNQVFNGKAEVGSDENGTEEIEKVQEEIDISKLSIDELRNFVVAQNDLIEQLQDKYITESAMYQKLTEMYLKLESYALKAEKVLESDIQEKVQAQDEVVEMTEYIKGLKAQNEELVATVSQVKEYAEKLEDAVGSMQEEDATAAKVPAYINEALVVNPALRPFEKELKKASSIDEARELMAKYSGMIGKVRLDMVMTEEDESEETSGQLTERSQYLKKHNYI